MPSAPKKKYVAVTGTRNDATTKEVDQTDTTAEPAEIEPEPVEPHWELTVCISY